MNRLELPTQSVSSVPTGSKFGQSFASRALRGGCVYGPTATPSATFQPIHYEKGYAYPLVVWLHGPGGNERRAHEYFDWGATVDATCAPGDDER